MAEHGYRLTVLTQEKAVLDESVTSIIAPGTEGYLGVLRNHAPLVTQLMPGKLTVKDLAGAETVYAVSGGFLEVNHNVATLLADALEKCTDIDLSRAEQAARRARERLAARAEDVDTARAEAALKRAVNRMKIAREMMRG
jgi:F-type H+-transporting ATPase subunit epsilon